MIATATPKKRKRNDPEKRVQSAIKRNLKTLGFSVMDLSQPRRSMMPLGLPDLYVRHQGWQIRLWIEVKAPNRKKQKAGGLSFEQLTWIRDEREAGGNVCVAYSLDDVLEALKALGAPIS